MVFHLNVLKWKSKNIPLQWFLICFCFNSLLLKSSHTASSSKPVNLFQGATFVKGCLWDYAPCDIVEFIHKIYNKKICNKKCCTGYCAFEDRHVVIWYRNMEESLADMSLHLWELTFENKVLISIRKTKWW